MFNVTAISSSRGKKRDVDPRRLLIQRAKFSPHVVVSAGVCFGGKGRLHFVPEKVKGNADFCVNDLLPKHIEDCCQTTSYSSNMVHRSIRLASLKHGSGSIVQRATRRMSGHQTHLTSILSTTTSGALYSSGTKCSLQSQPTRLNSRLCWRQSGKTCHKRLSTRLLAARQAISAWQPGR